MKTVRRSALSGLLSLLLGMFTLHCTRVIVASLKEPISGVSVGEVCVGGHTDEDKRGLLCLPLFTFVYFAYLLR